ncbi:unnamed protein product [Urochloa decumbens]|uniref:Uncharacterized protein n=1 Tax=Urochloa decumbens TaxID=240449 RepID=A0ABC8Y3K6_9POAL
MKNPRSDPAPGASSSQGSGGGAFARIEGRDVAGGVETASAWTGEKKAKFQRTNTSMDLDMTARDGSSEQADKAVHVIGHNNEREQGLGHIEGLDWDDDMLKEELDSYFERYHGLPDYDDVEAWTPIDDQWLKEMELRFAICRIRAHKMLKGEVLSDAEIRKMYPPSTLEENGYFQWFEHDFEWYFDPEYCQCAHLEDYQRLALTDTGEYLHWDYYHDTCSTLRSDQEFVYFWETLASKTEWFKNFQSAELSERKRIEHVVFYHAVKIAKECTHIFSTLLPSGYSEYLWSVGFDTTWYKDFACMYFEIWKLVAKQKMSLKDALDRVKEKGMRSFCRFDLEAEFRGGQQQWSGPITHNYNAYVAEIDENLTDDEAYRLIMEAVKEFVPKLKGYYDYAKKKLDIAEKIGLIPPAPT